MGAKQETLYSQLYIKEFDHTSVVMTALCVEFEAVCASAIPKTYTPQGIEYRFSQEFRNFHWAAMVEDARIRISPYEHKDGNFVAVNLIPWGLTKKDAGKLKDLQEILARHRFEPCSEKGLIVRYHLGKDSLDRFREES